MSSLPLHGLPYISHSNDPGSVLAAGPLTPPPAFPSLSLSPECWQATGAVVLVLHCGNFDEFSTHFLRQCRVVVSQRCHRIASLLRLALTQISGTDIHRYFRNAVLEQAVILVPLSQSNLLTIARYR